MFFLKITSTVCILCVQDSRLNMVILLPNKLDGLDTLETRLASSSLLESLDTMDRMESIRLKVAIPKFEMSFSCKLVQALKKMGVTDLFDRKVADLAAISGTRGMYVSRAYHRSFIQVDERGTVAAASTGNTFHCVRFDSGLL